MVELKFALKSLLMVILLLGITVAFPSNETPKNGKNLRYKDEQKEYFSHYGYYGPKSHDPTMAKLSIYDPDQALTEAVKRYQKLWHLKVTGIVDEDTRARMESKRCGNSDENLINSRRSKRFKILPGGKWQKRLLTYRIVDYPTNDLTPAQVDQEIARAFNEWSKVTSLTFQKVSYRSDIEIKFASWSHGDGIAFDGVRGDLAHAFWPRSFYSGDAHFDDSEKWTINVERGTDLFQIAVHEFGHSLGLDHTSVSNAVMYPFYSYLKPWRFSTDDVAGIQFLYGRPLVSPSTAQSTTATSTNAKSREDDTPTPNPTPPRSSSSSSSSSSPVSTTILPTATAAGNPQDFCTIPKIDAITLNEAGDILVFKGAYYAKLDDYSIMTGFPKTYTSDLPGLPSDIDAAVHLPILRQRRCRYRWYCWYETTASARNYYFKGSNYYMYENNVLTSSGSISSRFPGIPSSLDAVFTTDGLRLYFVKGNQVWRIVRNGRRIDYGFPKQLSSVIDGLPPNIDAVFTLQTRHTRVLYFFSGTQYYRTSGYRSRVDYANPPYPRSITTWWFGCPSNNGVSSIRKDDEFRISEGLEVPDEVLINQEGDLENNSMLADWETDDMSSAHCLHKHTNVFILLPFLVITVLFRL